MKLKKKCFTKVISLILTLCMFIPYVSNVKVKGATNDTFEIGDLEYEILTQAQNGKNGTVSVRGNNPSATSITIPEVVDYNESKYNVTEIADANGSIQNGAFYEYSNLTDIKIPNSIISIGDAAFANCKALTKIEIPNSITSLGSSIFWNCINLQDIKLSNSISSIPNAAFSNCYSLTNIQIPASVTSIDNFAFKNCSSLRNLELSSPVISIGMNVFENCNRIDEMLILSDKLQVLQENNSYISNFVRTKFYTTNETVKNQMVNAYNVPEKNIKIIDKSMIYTLKLNVNGIGKAISSGRYVEGETVTIKAMLSGNITKPYEFDNWNVTKGNVKLEDTNICETTFIMPNEDVEITANFSEFKSKYYLNLRTNLDIAGSVYGEGEYESGEEITIKAVANDGYKFDNWNIEQGKLWFEDNTLSEITFTMPEDYILITANFSKIYDTFETDYLKYTVTKKAENGKRGTVSVSAKNKFYEYPLSITIPKSVEHKGNIYDVTEIATVNNPYGEGAFSSYTTLTDIKIPDSIISIDDNAFANCEMLTGIEIPDSVTYIGYGAFRECRNLQNIKLSNSITSIYNSTFSNCYSLTNIEIPNSVTFIDFYAFYNCFKLNYLEIPSSVTSIDRNALAVCDNLKTVVVLSDNLKILPQLNPTEVNFTKTKFYVLNETIKNNFIDMYKIPIDNIKVVDKTKLHTLKINSNGNGSVTGAGKYLAGDIVNIEAFPNLEQTYEFYNWTVVKGNIELKSTKTPRTDFVMPDEDVEITANFSEIKDKYYVNIDLNNTLVGSIYGGGLYAQGEKVTIKAVANEGYKFESWEIYDDDNWLKDNTLSEITFTMPNHHINITANFSRVYDTFEIGDLKYTVIEKAENGKRGKVGVSGNNKNATSIVIPPSVENNGNIYDVKEITNNYDAFDNGAFYDYQKLKSIEIPDSITSIGNYAFHNCKGLESIEIPNSITSIGFAAFGLCTNLTNIKLSEALTFIDSRAFSECSSLSSIEIPASVTYINSAAFDNCYNLKNVVVLSNKLETIEYGNPFYGLLYDTKFYVINDEIKKQFIDVYEVPEANVKIIGTSKLHTLKLNSNGNGSVTGAGKYLAGDTVTINAFYFGIENYEFDSWTVIKGNVVLKDEKAYETTFVMPNEDVEITANFSEVKQKYYLELHSNSNVSGAVYGYGSYAGGEKVTIKAVPKEGYKFDGWYLEYGELPFEDNTLAEITFIMPNENISLSANFSREYDTFEIGDLQYEIIKKAENGRGKVSVRGNNKNATSIVIPASVEHNGNIYDVTEISNVDSSEQGAFYEYRNLVNIELPNSITSIGNYAFYNCDSLRNMDMPDSVTSIGRFCFSLSGLKDIKLSNSLNFIDNYAFDKCLYLTNIELPASLNYVGICILSNCNNLKTIVILSDKLKFTFLNNTFAGLEEDAKLYVINETIKRQLIDEFKVPEDKIEILDISNLHTLKLNSNGKGSVVGQGKYKQGDIVNITAIANKFENYKFIDWTVVKGNVKLENTNAEQTSFIMPDEDVEIVANFYKEENKYLLDLNTNLAVAGSVYGGGNYAQGEKVTIKAVANKGYRFEGWYINYGNIEFVDNMQTEITFTMPNQYVDIIAIFFEDRENIITDETFDFTITTKPTSSSIGTVSVKANDYSRYSSDLYIPDKVWDTSGNIYTVTKINNNAFENCKKLQTINIPNTVTSIGSNAFGGCSNLQVVSIEADKISVEKNAFPNANPSILFNVKNESVKQQLLPFVLSESQIHISDESEKDLYVVAVEMIEGGEVSGFGFYKPKDIVTLKVKPKEGYRFVNWYVSYGNIKIEDYESTEISFEMPAEDVCVIARFEPYNDTEIEDYKNLSFDIITKPNGSNNGTVCVKLNNYYDKYSTYIEIPETVTDISGNKYTVTTIDDNAFAWHVSLQNIKLPNTITSIGNNAFESCINLTDINIPNSVKSIGNDAFKNCNALQIVTIQSNNITIGSDAFSNVSNNIIFTIVDESIKEQLLPFVTSEIQIRLSDGSTQNIHKVNLKSSLGGSAAGNGVYVVGETVNLSAVAKENYKFDRWIIISKNLNIENIHSPNISFKMPDKDVTIMANFDYLYGNNGLLNNKIGDSFIKEDTNLVFTVTQNAANNLLGAVSLTGTESKVNSVVIPSTVIDENKKSYRVPIVSDYAFADDKDIETIIIEDGIIAIGKSAFENCTNLKNITLPNINSIGTDAFKGISNNAVFKVPNQAVKDLLIQNNVAPSQIEVINTKPSLQEATDKANELLKNDNPSINNLLESIANLSNAILENNQKK